MEILMASCLRQGVLNLLWDYLAGKPTQLGDPVEHDVSCEFAFLTERLKIINR